MKTSGATVSSSAAALRCSSRNRWMRSRASGGTCGDSVAAVSAETRSSLRRRATWITRASSTWRSSIGGRASARTTAAASCGSTSRRIQASTSRTSARSRKAAAPRSSPAASRPAAQARSSGASGTVSQDTSATSCRGTAAHARDTSPRAMPAREATLCVVDVIDWGAAQRIGELIAGSPPYGGVRAASVEPLAHDFAGRVSDYSGLALPARAAAAGGGRSPGVDRGEPEDDAPAARRRSPSAHGRCGNGPASPDRCARRRACCSARRWGRLTGVLSQRVLGQYDLALLDATVAPRLLLLAPNLAQAARNLGVDRDELVLWVTHPRDHPRRPVLRRAVAARASRGDAQGADRRPAGDDSAGGRTTARISTTADGNGADGSPRRVDAETWAREAARLPTRRAARAGRARPPRRAAAPDARRGALAAGRADAGDDVADRGTRRAHDGRGRRRGAAVAAAPARRAEPPPRDAAGCRGACSSGCSGWS